MKNNRKLTCIILALFLAFTASACAGKTGSENSGGVSDISTVVTVSEAPESDDTADSRDTEESKDTKDSSAPDKGTETVTTEGGLTMRITTHKSEYSDTNDLYDTIGDTAADADGRAEEKYYEAPESTAKHITKGELVTNDAMPRSTAAPSADAPTVYPTEELDPTVTTDPKLIIDEPYVPDEPTPQAGLLTAGEWNDNDNWGFFTNLVTANTVTFPSYGIDPENRTKVTLHTSDNKPVMNAKVSVCKEDGTPLWTGVTNKNGTAFLFTQNDEHGAYLLAEFGDTKQQYDLHQKTPDTQQGQSTVTNDEYTLTFDSEGKAYKNTDIMFIMDATGSMSDEMLFLQSEFTAISEAAGDENTRYSVNFYRDKGDEFTTKCYDFTKDVKALQEKLNSESADGGGDTPEAVAEILEETIRKSNWDEESVKLAFMIFDAPPHEEAVQSLQTSVKAAAEKGIRLIPVISSGTERDTELFGRAVSIVTGGTYVFLTDDSGIGNSHLEPIIGSYKTEKLYDIIIRIIESYKQ